MNLDPIDALTALARAGARTARSRYVDSAEDAVAFAERRNADDPRIVPIVLCNTMTAQTEPLTSEHAIERAYRRLRDAGPVIAQVALPPGPDVFIVGDIDAAGNRAVHLKDRAYGHREPPKTERMLEHLVNRVSKVFGDTRLQRLRVTARLHDNAYTVTQVAGTASVPLYLEPRLGKRGHDRKGDEYHASGRQ